ncbi:cysteine desulfurase [Paenibacillus hemerocallicola]|uniref:Cysteine desulfurase n=1 Tax=Paenibacillus hemerocallicola TaxID=1172614 RepID=A0A5C4T720_9BACL|nr:cysteine desulfurase family protein [Paenibacillus hemerocallicola]TNJ64157.1 cysteine desulfurase [Paenibacillus hemerocallicola]
MLYFDHCATTPPYAEVIDAVGEVMGGHFGNPSSIHRIGSDAEKLLRKARENVAKLLRSSPEEIVFTSGGTESNNLAILGTALKYATRGKHVVTTAIEHASVYECFRYLESIGYEVTFIRPDSTGKVHADVVLDAVRDDTILVSVMHVNNEVGTIQPVQQIGRALREHRRVLFHVDAVQSIGVIPLYPAEWGIDLLSASAHKIRGPKGAGLLYRRRGVELQPMLIGGGQENGLRSGTENVPCIVGFAKAFRMTADSREEAARRMTGLRSRFLTHAKRIPGLIYNGSDIQREMAPHIVHFSAPGIKSEVFVHALEEHDIYISTKSACSSGEDRPSRVLLALGADHARAVSGLRISFSAEHTPEQIDKLANAMESAMHQLRRFR